MTREEIQNNATKAIVDADYNGIVDVAPRVGKSKILIEAIRGKSNRKIVISSPFDTLRKNWINEIEHWKLDFNPECICSKSLKKIPEEIDLLVLDEAQMLSLGELVTIQKKKPKRILVLSGTLNPSTKADLYIFFRLQNIFTYSIEQAIEDKIISDFEVNVIYCDFDNEKKDIVSGTKKFPKVVTEKEHYSYLTKQYETFKLLSMTDFSYRSIRDMYMRKRTAFIYQSKTKLDIAKKLVDLSDRCLVFTGNTEQADYLCEHSYTIKNKKEKNLEKMINQEIDKCAVINMSSVGITIFNLKHVIMHQCQSNDEISVQKILRGCNLEGERIAKIDILCYRNSVDQDWVESALGSVNRNRIKYLDIKEILEAK